tara:strand:- start:646 stop:813 length:168 start_codon:yes stop_codon:yes gene_type:complete
MKKLFLLILLTSCISQNGNYKNNDTLNFNKDLGFDEFKELLIKYSELTPYPNIDK